MAAANSSYRPTRPRWTQPSSRAWRSGVRVGCGALPRTTPFTPIPCGASSLASEATSPVRPALPAAYPAPARWPNVAEIDDTATMRPEPCATMVGIAARAHRNGAVRFRARKSCHSPSGVSATVCHPEPGRAPPALATRTSSRPWSATTDETIDATASSEQTSAGAAVAPWPSVAAASAARPASTSFTTTVAPSDARRRGRGQPDAPPGPGDEGDPSREPHAGAWNNGLRAFSLMTVIFENRHPCSGSRRNSKM